MEPPTHVSVGGAVRPVTVEGVVSARGSGGGAAAGRLFVVSTPIGNMGDFSFRGVEVLRAAAVILAEDTRHTRLLLDRHGIHTPMQAYHDHNEERATPGVLARLAAGDDVALVSDAGTPLLSDPGARLVNAAIVAGVAVVPVPGASAALAALVVSGLPAQPFTFVGFLARSGAQRTRQLDGVAASPCTTVLYEAPGRLAGTLGAVAERVEEGRRAAVARELTKVHEEVRRGTVRELAAYYSEVGLKGEVVVVVAAAPARALNEAAARARARELRAQGQSVRDVAQALAREFDAGRNVAYRMAQDESI